jgi:antitoxin HicB
MLSIFDTLKEKSQYERCEKVKSIIPPYPFEIYAHIVRPLTKDEGGGFLITFPDLPGCMSDGETMEEAKENGCDAFLGLISIGLVG